MLPFGPLWVVLSPHCTVMLSASLRLSHGGTLSTGSSRQRRGVGLRSSPPTPRYVASTIQQHRRFTSFSGATVEGTAKFFSEERKEQRLKDLKSRMESKRLMALNEDQTASELPSVGEFQSPLIKPKVNAKTGWTLGPIGFGTQRLSSQSMEHQAALYAPF